MQLSAHTMPPKWTLPHCVLGGGWGSSRLLFLEVSGGCLGGRMLGNELPCHQPAPSKQCKTEK